jgi:anaerobic C4-dicarboxylate transporter
MSWILIEGSKLMESSKLSVATVAAHGALEVSPAAEAEAALEAQLNVFTAVLCALLMLMVGPTLGSSNRTTLQTVQFVKDAATAPNRHHT